IEMAYSRQGIALSHRKYTLDIVRDTSLMGAKPVDTPTDSNVKFDNEKGDLTHEHVKYRRFVGKLNYLTITSPDISFAVGVVSQFMSAPRKPYWDAVLRIVKYLKNAPGHGFLFNNHGHLRVMSHSDGDKKCGCPMDRRSISGYCVFVGGNLVSWKSKKQPLVSRSSAEDEYRAMTHAVSELTWARMLLVEIGFTAPQTTLLHCDNQFAIHIALNPVFHKCTKHIKEDCHFIREKIKRREIILHHTRSKDQIAYLFTQSL
ncbi:LOW QUALITY PROTEIN: hypothetical protein CFOL_v3_19846, partial [Cephalotus follicularis]